MGNDSSWFILSGGTFLAIQMGANGNFQGRTSSQDFVFMAGSSFSKGCCQDFGSQDIERSFSITMVIM